jgi:hypothetical protein
MSALSKISGRNAAIPFTLNLNRYQLQKSTLQQVCERSLFTRKEWTTAACRVAGASGGIVQVEVSKAGETYCVTLVVSESSLEVTCNCGQQVRSLCRHAFAYLYHHIAYPVNALPLEHFRPQGLVEMAFAHRQLFDIRPGSPGGLRVQPLKTAGYLYPFSGNDPADNHIFYTTLAQLNNSTPLKHIPPAQTMCYMMVRDYTDQRLPFVLPLLGTFNRQRTGIRRFGNFLSGTGKEHRHLLTPVQVQLNQLCYHLFKLCKLLDEAGTAAADRIFNIAGAQLENLQLAFGQLEQLLPLLQEQHFFLYTGYRERDLKAQPARRRILPLKLQTERISVQGMLKQGNAYRQLLPAFRLGERRLKNASLAAYFFVQTEAEPHEWYLLASLKDVLLAAWFRHHQNCITIFDTHYAQFEEQVLSRLSGMLTIQ